MAQLNKNRSSSAASEFNRGRIEVDAQALDDLIGVGGRRAVGYRPEIEQIMEGASLNASASTADRLYVLVAPTPDFTQITEVSTFNILGDAETAQGETQDFTP